MNTTDRSFLSQLPVNVKFMNRIKIKYIYADNTYDSDDICSQYNSPCPCFR